MRKLKLFSLALMALFATSTWAAAGDAEVISLTSGNITANQAKAYDVTADNDVLADAAIYATARNAISADAEKGLEPNNMGFLFKPAVNCKVVIIGVNTTTSDRNFSNKVFEVTNTDMYPMVKASSSYNGSISKYLLENYTLYTTKTQEEWKNLKMISKNSGNYIEDAANASKTVTGETAQSALYSQITSIQTISITKRATSKDPNVVETKTFSTSEGEYIFQAGKTYAIYLHRSSSGLYVKELSFVPVYQLTWDFDGGSSSEEAGTDYSAAGYYAKGAELDYPGNASMSKAGFAFAGWSSSAATMPASNLTITAEWEALAYYDVTYTSAKGVAPSSKSDVAFVNLAQITGVDGWRNIGWIANKDVTIDAVTVEAGELLANGKKAYLTDDTEFTAQWAQLYSVTYNANGATGDAPTEGQHIAGEKFDIADQGSLEAPTNTFFSGWSYNTNTYTAGDEFEMPASDVEFTAIWLHHYAVTYNKGAYGSGTIEAGEKIEGIAFTLSAERFTRENYVQVGWATTDGGAQAYSLGGSYTANADIELFPVWMEAEAYTYNATAAKTIATLKSEGWEFHSDEFDADPTDTEAYVNTVDAMNTAKLTAPKTNGMDDNAIAFAKSTGAYAIFDLGEEVKIVDFSATLYGGSGSAFNETIEYLGANKSTVKKSYTNSLGAGNWQANDINKNDVVEDVRYIKIYGASKWVVMSALNIAYVPKYTISFAAGEGEGNMDAIQYYSGDEVTLPACTFTAPTGKKFAAWTSDDVTITDGKFTMLAKDVTVTATYATLYNITCSSAENGSVTADKEQAIAGETVTLTATPSEGYVLQTLKVLKASDDSDVTESVLEGNVLTMPAYAVKVVATFAEDSATSLDNTEAGVKTVKRLENGMLVIEKDGKTYNVMGQAIR